MSILRRSLGLMAPLALLSLGACGDGKTDSVQVGYRGTGMEQNYDHGDLKKTFAQVKIPTPLPPAGESPPGPLPWQNVQDRKSVV